MSNSPKPGSRVRVLMTDGRSFDGLVLPADHLVLKLDDGYNLGFHDRHVKSVEQLPDKEVGAAESASVTRDDSLPKVLLLHTGGTIASKVDYETGGTSNLIEPEELLGMYPELQGIAHVEAEFVANMSSDDMRFGHMNIIAKAIADKLDDGFAGIVVTTGTDYMSFVGASLHYALRNIPIPVVLTGSQRSSDRGSSDAATNLAGAVRFALSENPGVFIAMHESSSDERIAIHRAVHVRKMHTSRRDAFKSVNDLLVASVQDEEIIFHQQPAADEAKFSLSLFDASKKVGLCYSHANFFAEQLSCYDGFDAIVIAGSGLGHLPINQTDDVTAPHEEIFAEIKRLAKKMPVVITSHCIHGRVNLQVYSAGRKLQELGVLGHGLAFTPETAHVKLAWLLSQGIDPRKGMEQDFGDRLPFTEVADDGS